MSALVNEIRQELAQVATAPAGRARSSRAEALVDRARATADAPLLLNAMATLMSAYDRSDERGRMFEVFDQALRLWDEDPSLFGDRASTRLVGEFEWISGLDHPEVPLASIERWAGEWSGAALWPDSRAAPSGRRSSSSPPISGTTSAPRS